MLPGISKELAFNSARAVRLEPGARLHEGPNADHEGFEVLSQGQTVHILKEEHLSEKGMDGRRNGYAPVLVDLSGDENPAKAQILWIVTPAAKKRRTFGDWVLAKMPLLQKLTPGGTKNR